MARRILVALDGHDLSRSLLDFAARLAAARRAELCGLYVEESEFLAAAGLPFSRTLRLQGQGWESADPDTMAQALRARAAELSRELAQVAAHWNVEWSFRSERGVPGERLQAATREAELIVLGRSRRGRRAPLGRAARRIVTESVSSVLLVGTDAEPPARITAFYAGDDSALAAGEELARLFGRPLEVAVLGASAGEAETRKAEAARWLEARRLPQRIATYDASDPHRLATDFARHAPGLAVVPAGAGPAGLDLGGLLDALDCPVLVVRGGPAPAGT